MKGCISFAIVVLIAPTVGAQDVEPQPVQVLPAYDVHRTYKVAFTADGERVLMGRPVRFAILVMRSIPFPLPRVVQSIWEQPRIPRRQRRESRAYMGNPSLGHAAERS